MGIFQKSVQVYQEKQTEIINLKGDITIIIETKRKGRTATEGKKSFYGFWNIINVPGLKFLIES